MQRSARLGKTRWHVATGSDFEGPRPRYPLGALVYYRAKGDLGEPIQRNLDFLQVGTWHLASDITATFSLLTMRGQEHTSSIGFQRSYTQETFLPPIEHVEFPLARAARIALLNMADVDMVLKRDEYDRSLVDGVLPSIRHLH